MRKKLFTLKTILTIILLLIAIATQFTKVLGAENEDVPTDTGVMPMTINPDDVNVWWVGDRDYEYEYSSCGNNMAVPDYSSLVDGYNYYITDFYASDMSNNHKTIEYKKALVVTDYAMKIMEDVNGSYFINTNSGAGTFYNYYELTYQYSLDNTEKTCTLKDNSNYGKWNLAVGESHYTNFYDLATLKKHVRSNQDIYFEDNLVISSDSINLPEVKGNYFTFLENSSNEITELGWKDKEFFSMGDMPNFQYIHVRKQLNVTKDEYFQFLFTGSFYGIEKKEDIMNVSIQLLDEEGNASEIIPVEYSYSADKGLMIKHKVSKSPINATQIELLVSLKNEYQKGNYGHFITEFDIASDSSGETNSWLGGIFDSITKLPELIIDGLSSLLQGIIDAVVGLGTFIVDGIVLVLELIIDAVVNIGTFIIDGLQDLFIPSDDFFSKYFSDLYDFFSKKLGILIAPFEVLITIVNRFLSIGEGSGVLVIPNITILSYHLISAQTFDLKGFFNVVLGSHYNLYYAFVDCILAFLLIRLAFKKWSSIVGGSTNDN